MTIDRERLASLIERTVRVTVYDRDHDVSNGWEAFDAVVADLAAQGYVIVPREPTVEMLIAGRKQTFADMTGEHLGPNTERTYKAMITAANPEQTEQ